MWCNGNTFAGLVTLTSLALALSGYGMDPTTEDRYSEALVGGSVALEGQFPSTLLGFA